MSSFLPLRRLVLVMSRYCDIKYIVGEDWICNLTSTRYHIQPFCTEDKFNGKFGHTIRGREREGERESIHTTQFKIIILCVHRMCSVNTFYTSPNGLTEVLTCTSMLITELYTNPKIYSSAEYLSNSLAVYAPLWLLVAHRFAHRFMHPVFAPVRPNRSVPTDPVLGLHIRSGQCWACLSTCGNMGW